MTLEIDGRGLYNRDPSVEIYQGSDWGDDPLFRLTAADLQEFDHNRGFRVITKHENGTDFEHDGAYLFELEGAGLSYHRYAGGRLMFHAVGLKVRHYDKGFEIAPGVKTDFFDTDCDEIGVCDSDLYHPADQDAWPKGHLIMPYMPPRQKLKVGQIYLVFNFDKPGRED